MKKSHRYYLLFFILMPLTFLPAAYPVMAADADIWKNIREGISGYTAVKGQETGVLIQSSGQNWRKLRNGPLIYFGAWGLALTVLGIGFFFLFRGRIRLKNKRTGEAIPRWTLNERLLHWITATLFLILMLTGLSLLYGRQVLIPLVGKPLFSEFAALAKTTHNFIGPLFFVGLLLMLFSWGKDNIPSSVDLHWLKSFGGMIGDGHPSAGRINAGEKIWFWLLVFSGIAVCATGLILDFTNLGQERAFLQASHLIHVGSALLLSMGALGHMYIGSLGTEGALEGMVHGRVNAVWAEQHHDLWYEALKKEKQASSRSSPE